MNVKRAPRFAAALAAAVTIAVGRAPAADCTVTSTGLVPITDLGANAYLRG